ncbi:MAG TPA: ribbon-helix-helix protein, CopG family [Polyangiaceae bacterium]|nr:ribbon-helix-helix protein, CopG family [Polyangiaceae bacterium]
MTARLNARIDASLARKVAYLRARTRKSTTEVVKASIEAYYEKLRASEGAVGLLADFVGSGSADSGLSTRYKQLLSSSLGRKAPR